MCFMLSVYIEEYQPQHHQPAERSENSIFGMTLEVAVALTKIDKDDLIPAVFKRCIEYLDDLGKLQYTCILLIILKISVQSRCA